MYSINYYNQPVQFYSRASSKLSNMHYPKSKQPTKKKTNADMRVIAHQKAPLDYISPWEAQHQQYYLTQSQNMDNLQVKQKSQDKAHNVVNSFLEKIRKTHSLFRKNKLSKNFSAQEKEKDREREDLMLAANGGKGFNGGKGGISRMQSGIDGSVAEKDIVTNMSDSRAAQDFGFGRMHYTKNDISNHQTQQIKRASTQLGNSYSRKLNKTQTEPHYDSFNPSLLNPNNQFLPSQHRTRTLINQNTHTSKIFSRQDLSNPKQIVFIKKKKNKKNITIVDINSTAQEFYEEQIRYAEQKMVQKYRRLKNRDQCRVVRCETQGGGKKMGGGRRKSGEEGKGKGKWEFSDRRVEFPFNKEELKKRYCFMEELKDQTIAVRIQNIMRCHPSLANTLLITK